MKLTKYQSSIAYLIFVFCSIFVQMGLFVHFQRWLSFSFEGSAFWWRSMLLQVAIFAPSIFMILSWAGIIGMCTFCFYKVFKKK